jgi:PTH1 family peptidyl-tRNA hydrolase
MNASGNAVRYWANKKKIEVDHILIVCDDLALPFGTLRMKGGGSEGGHNGLRSITQCLGTNQYARLRFGIGHNYSRGAQADFVLGSFCDEELSRMDERVETAGKMITTFCLAGLNEAMNLYNGK